VSAVLRVPRAAEPFLQFARELRAQQFAVAPEQVKSFLSAVSLLGPRSIEDIRQAGLATLAPPPDRHGAYDAVFRAVFLGDTVSIAEGAEEDEEIRVKDSGVQQRERDESLRQEKGGALTSAIEQLSLRDFEALTNEDRLSQFRHDLPQSLPVRRSFRSNRTRSRGQIDLRRSLREIVQSDGDVPCPLLRKRQAVPRRIVLLIDISGSMKLHTLDYLKLAHAVVQATGNAEVFTFGTRLSRITRPLRIRDGDSALAAVARGVDDWDGGTRIGSALLAFLAVPRFTALARGAAVCILSDGLERGDHGDMERAMRRLSARAFRLSLCTPLAGDARFQPDTAALRAVLPLLDDLTDGSSIERLTSFILSLGRAAPPAETIWRRHPNEHDR